MTENLNSILPEIFLTLSIFTLLMLGVFIKKSYNLVSKISLLILLMTIFFIVDIDSNTTKIFSESFIVNPLINFIKILILVSSAFVMNTSQDFIKDNNLVKSSAKWGKENEARSLASMIALRKAMKALPIKNAVSFHSSIERATRNKDVQEHITNTYNYKPIDTYHVSGKLPTTKRNDVVQEFAKSDKALITNSRCLTEGVDVPNIDCIVY